MKSTESKTALITAAVEKYLSENINLKIKNKILIAYSSGPDSTVILDVLYRMTEKYNMEIICAYYNHKLRNDAELSGEILIAEENCRIRNIKLIKGYDSGEIKKNIPVLGTEGAARKYRYIFLEKVFNDEKCDFTASGHNLDDQIETVVMRLFKGSGASGLKGISGRNGKFIRPLISVSKKNILKYLEENKIRFSTDKSNNENIFLRNRIRNILLPAAEEIFPGMEKSVVSLSEKMSMTEKYIKKEAFKKIQWAEEEDGYSTDIDNFFRQPEIIQLESLYSASDMIFGDESIRIPYAFLKPLIGTEKTVCRRVGAGLETAYWNGDRNSTGDCSGDGGMLNSCQTGQTGDGGFKKNSRQTGDGGMLNSCQTGQTGDGGLNIAAGRFKNSPVYLEGYGIIIFRTGKKLFFKKTAAHDKQKPFSLNIEDKKRIYPICKNRYICIEEKTVSECSENDLWLDPECIEGRLYIRYREDGDRIALKGGKKKIKKLFTEMGIQMDQKDIIPLICDNTGILAVMGSAYGYRDRIAEKIYVKKSKNSKVLIFRTRQV